MFGIFHQGDIIKIEKIKFPVLVVSKDFFNATGQIIGCPVLPNATKGPLHITITGKEVTGIVICEELKKLDLRIRGCKKIDVIQSNELMNIADAIQGIFDYI